MYSSLIQLMFAYFTGLQLYLKTIVSMVQLMFFSYRISYLRDGYRQEPMLAATAPVHIRAFRISPCTRACGGGTRRVTQVRCLHAALQTIKLSFLMLIWFKSAEATLTLISQTFSPRCASRRALQTSWFHRTFATGCPTTWRPSTSPAIHSPALYLSE